MAWLLQSLGLAGAGSPFETLEEVPWRRNWYWKQYQGRRTEGGGSVSIFRATISELGDQLPLARRAFTKTKTMRHPHILNIIEGFESETEIEIVTESVIPLWQWLEKWVGEGVEVEQRDASVVWGIRCILQALSFIHSQGMIHGLVCPESIFVTSSGDFKLWGLDLLSNLENADDVNFFKASESQLAVLSHSDHFRSPERVREEWDKLTKHFAASDVWSIGQALPSLFEGREMPGELSRAQKKMVASPVVARPKIERMLASDLFLRHPYVEAMSFIEELSLKSHVEMVTFFKQLTNPMHFMPTATRVHKLIPALKSGIERSIGPDKRPEECREMVAATLPVLSEIGSTMTGDEYRNFVVPAVLPLFQVSDRAVRMQLLERIEGLVKHMDSNTVNGRIFESLNAGFSDTAKVLRELTLKSMLSLVSKLDEKNLNDSLMRTLAKLQVDPEPSIRTNTTIFYGKVATHLNEGIRVKVIVPAFLKGMKDSFPYARLAAVRATSACKGFYEPQVIAHKILPVVVTMLLDPYSLVREAAFDCVQALLEPLRVNSAAMTEQEQAKATRAKAETEAKRLAEGPKIGELAGSLAKHEHGDTPLAAALHGTKNVVEASGGGVSPSDMKKCREEKKSKTGSLGFRSTSDSSFWDAIDDDPPLTSDSKSSGVGGGPVDAHEWDTAGWGNDGADDLDDLEGLENLEETRKETTSPLVNSTVPGEANQFSGISEDVKPLASENQAPQTAKKDGVSGRATKLSASKLSSLGAGGDDWDW